MSGALAFRLSAVFGLLAVALGAFGAHSLRYLLVQNNTVAVWEKAVFYHLVHAVVLLVVASRAKFAQAAWFCFAAGILVFSGSLYILALTNVRWWGAITPFGGASLIAGWACLIFGCAGKKGE